MALPVTPEKLIGTMRMTVELLESIIEGQSILTQHAKNTIQAIIKEDGAIVKRYEKQHKIKPR